MHEVLVNRLGGLSLPRKSVVRLTDRPDMTLDVYRGRKTTMQQLFIHRGSEVPFLFETESHFSHMLKAVSFSALKRRVEAHHVIGSDLTTL